MDIMKKVEELLSEGKSPKEIVGMGYARSTVYAVAKKVNKNKGDFEVELDTYDLIQQMAQWIDLLIIDSRFFDGTKPVPCLDCANNGETDFMMKLNKAQDKFECPRCGEYLWNAGQLGLLANICLVKERLKRGFKPPGAA
jgi:hypothetical protein